MAGPWEQYQQTAPVTEGPWSKYAELVAPQTAAPTREDLIAAIPGTPAQPYVRKPAPSVSDRILGTLETPVAVGQSLLAMPLGAASALYKKATGQPSNIDTEMARFAPRPSTQTAQENLQTLGDVFEASKLPPMPGVTGGLASSGINQLAGPAIRQAASSSAARAIIQEGQLLADAAKYPLDQRAAAKQAKLVQQSYDRAAKIEAANKAHDAGYVVDPSLTNPTTRTKVETTLAGQRNLQKGMIQKNEGVTEARMREDLGMPKNADLRDKQVWETALNQKSISEPYGQIRNLGTVVDDGSIVDTLNGLRNEFVWSKEDTVSMMKAIDNAVNQVESKLTGEQVLEGVRKLRNEANNIYTAKNKGAVVDPDKINVAEAKMQIADTLEQLLQNNITDPKFRDAFKTARTEAAKIYDAKNATNPLTGKIDPFHYVEKAKNHQVLSGFGKNLSEIAGNYPELFKSPEYGVLNLESLRRSSPAGVLGAGVGAAAGLTGAALGPAALTGVGVGLIGQRLMRNRLLSPEYQATHAMPIDYRTPTVNQLIPKRPPISNVPAVYDFTRAVNEGTPSYQPNWTYGQREVNPNVRPEMPAGAPQLGYNPNAPYEGVKLRAQQTLEQERRQNAAAEAAAEAAAQASRRPASREVLFDFDPITGKLQPISRGLPGATPETISSTGHNLKSASEKVASGRLFDMTAAEKVAWEKTKVDLAEVDPGFKNLSDKAVADRMMDRDWVANAVKKAREKEAMFAQLEQNAKSQRARADAAREREKMMQYAEDLDEYFQNMRPSSKIGQGPKTREAIRNQLLGGSEPINSLRR